MNIFFTASLRGQKKFLKEFQQIYALVEKFGHKNLDDFVIKGDFSRLRESTDHERVAILKKAIKLINKAEIVVFEVSTHSLSMGYLINKALEEGKPVILLYKEETRPFLPIGLENPNLQIIPYRNENLELEFKEAINEAKKRIGVRFTIILPPKISSFLDRVARGKKIPRSVFIRNLIEKEMKKNI